jgi:hypothetical protein
MDHTNGAASTRVHIVSYLTKYMEGGSIEDDGVSGQLAILFKKKTIFIVEFTCYENLLRLLVVGREKLIDREGSNHMKRLENMTIRVRSSPGMHKYRPGLERFCTSMRCRLHPLNR